MQINGGTPVTDQIENAPDNAMRSASASDDGHLPIMVRTVLNLQRDAMAYWENMTCLFNKWWRPEKDRLTLPFCFFHITQYSETEQRETSQKRVLLYQPPEEEAKEGSAQRDSTDKVSKPIIETIIDNTVRKPKSYKVEAIVPFLPFGAFVNHGIAFKNTVEATIETFMGDNDGVSQGGTEYIMSQLNGVFGVDGVASKMDLANRTFLKGYDAELSALTPADRMVNKNSLDAMFESGHLLQFKTWMGHDYKYVIITDKTIEKKSVEDDVWRVSMTLQEMPVLSLTRVRGKVTETPRSWTVETVDRMGDAVLGDDQISKKIPALQVEGA